MNTNTQPAASGPVTPISATPGPAFLRLKQIVAPHGILPVARSTFLHWVATGRAPQGTKLNGVTLWSRDAIMAMANGEGMQ